MSIDDQGFLSETDIRQFRDQIRQQYARYFDLIHRVNGFCQQAKFRLYGVSTTGQNLMAVHLLIKLLGDTQGAVLLVERGLASQARALLRTACETCILLAAYSTPKLPPIPGESCHRFQVNPATDSTAKLPPVPHESCH
jgi:hypothetical protein